MKPLKFDPQTYYVELNASEIDGDNDICVSGSIGSVEIPEFYVQEKSAEVIGQWFLKLSYELQKKRIR